MVDVQAYLDAQREKDLDKLFEFLRIPSVSATSQHKRDMLRAAEWLVRELRVGHAEFAQDRRGGPSDRLCRAHRRSGLAHGALYGHYDVQPVDPEALWTTPPFEPNMRNGRIYARGASDDKGQVFMHMRALKAHPPDRGEGCPERAPCDRRRRGGRVGKFGPLRRVGAGTQGRRRGHFRHVDACNRRTCDLLQFAGHRHALNDGARRRERPAFGTFGGAVPNPLHELARLVASLHDDAGRRERAGFLRRRLAPDRRSARCSHGYLSTRRSIRLPWA